MWSAAAAVTCATVGLSGSIAASATTTKPAHATQTVTSPAGEKDKRYIPYPRLDTTSIITGFTVGGAAITPTTSATFTGSARRGHVWVHDGTRWVDVTSRFPTGYYYDISLAPAPSTAFSAVGGVLTGATTTGIPAGIVRVTVREADGRILRSDCTVSTTTGVVQPLAVANCGAPVTVS